MIEELLASLVDLVVPDSMAVLLGVLLGVSENVK